LTEHLWFETPHRRDCLNLTDKVENPVRKSGVQEGLCLVNAMHGVSLPRTLSVMHGEGHGFDR
jgi:thiamine phosphate synthase YjbQ (UPF0047 family)